MIDAGSVAIVGDKYIALEWLETTLVHIQYHPSKDTHILVAKILGAVLQSCIVLESRNLVHTSITTDAVA